MPMVNGRPYNNRYVFRSGLRDGKTQRIREYCNPVTSAMSFGIPLSHLMTDMAAGAGRP